MSHGRSHNLSRMEVCTASAESDVINRMRANAKCRALSIPSRASLLSAQECNIAWRAANRRPPPPPQYIITIEYFIFLANSWHCVQHARPNLARLALFGNLSRIIYERRKYQTCGISDWQSIQHVGDLSGRQRLRFASSMDLGVT